MLGAIDWTLVAALIAALASVWNAWSTQKQLKQWRLQHVGTTRHEKTVALRSCLIELRWLLGSLTAMLDPNTFSGYDGETVTELQESLSRKIGEIVPRVIKAAAELEAQTGKRMPVVELALDRFQRAQWMMLTGGVSPQDPAIAQQLGSSIGEAIGDAVKALERTLLRDAE